MIGRLKRRAEFLQVAAANRKWVAPGLILQVCRRHETAPETVLKAIPKLRALQEDGIIQLDGTVLSVNDNARFLVRTVASAFDAYLGQSGRTHSRAV